ncbi:MAG: glycine--tRNA ligase subunit beta [Rhizomicrobium sp.]
MPDLLLELRSEEIPARMQGAAAKDLERLVVGALSDRGLLFEGVKAFAGPRRLTLAITGLPAKQPDVSEEIKGPKVDAPQAAIDGFLRKSGLAKEQLKIEKTPKGDVYLAVIARKGRATAEVLAEVLPEIFAKLPWPKSMRFPASAVRWVRPLHGIVCTFDGEVVPFEFAGVTSGSTTLGHRFLSKGAVEVRRFEDYEAKLRAGHVILDAAERKEIIQHELNQKAFALGLEPIADDGLLDEVAGLAEWPVVLIGAIEDQFMDVPPEILQTSMRTHQKYFALSFGASLRDAPQDDAQHGSRHAEVPAEGGPRSMAPRFAVVSNMAATDGGKEIIAGNERVLRARLSDAKFFWDQDRKRTLESRVEDLKNIVFHAKLGTQYERVERIEALAGDIAEKIGADVTKAKRAARLCKADLTTGVVGEFPELQGIMGRYYALHNGEDGAVADACSDHYGPIGPSDTVPTKPVSVTVALADKLDTLIGFFAINEKPTGSSDPFALRRAGLGVIRILLENNIRMPLASIDSPLLLFAMKHFASPAVVALHRKPTNAAKGTDFRARLARQAVEAREESRAEKEVWNINDAVVAFLADRLKVALREKGTRHDLIDAVFSLGNEDDLVRLVARVEALQEFLKSDDGANLLTAYKRGANILKAEEKKDKTAYDGEPDPEAFVAPEEKGLFVELATASELIRAEVERERFVEAMGVMARLRKPVDAFFEHVTVNDKDPDLRKNRLKLLSRLRATLHLVADFSKIEG